MAKLFQKLVLALLVTFSFVTFAPLTHAQDLNSLDAIASVCQKRTEETNKCSKNTGECLFDVQFQQTDAGVSCASQTLSLAPETHTIDIYKVANATSSGAISFDTQLNLPPEPVDPELINDLPQTSKDPAPVPTPIPTIKPIIKPSPSTTPQSTISPTPSPTPEPPPPTKPQGGSTLNPEVLFNMINQHRTSKGLPAYEKEGQVCRWAQERAPELDNEVFGSSFIHAGFRKRNYGVWITENMIAYATEQESFNWWLRSGVHRAAIESQEYKYSCGACQGRSCVQMFTSLTPK